MEINKKNINSLISPFLKGAIFLFVLVLMYGCQKSPINGDLDGKWQVMEILPYPGDVKDSKLYYGFYLHVCSLSFYGGSFTDGNMIYDKDTLYLEFPYISTEEGLEKLSLYGIDSNPITFKVDYIDKNSLIISSEETTVKLRKF